MPQTLDPQPVFRPPLAGAPGAGGADEQAKGELRPAGGTPGHDDTDDEGEGGSGGDGGPWMTVATFWDAGAANIARLKLESEDIACYLIDEHIVGTYWLWSNALGGIKLRVPATDAARAAELLDRSATAPARAGDDQPLYDGQVKCPRCGSEDIHKTRLDRRLVFLSILLLGAPLPIFRRRTRCEACGFDW